MLAIKKQMMNNYCTLINNLKNSKPAKKTKKMKALNKHFIFSLLLITSCVSNFKYNSETRQIYSNNKASIIGLVICSENREECNFYTLKEESSLNNFHIDSIDYYFTSSNRDFKLERESTYYLAIRIAGNFDKGPEVLKIKY